LVIRRKDTVNDELPVDQHKVSAQKPQLAYGGGCGARAIFSREHPGVKILDLVSALYPASIGNNDVTVGLPKPCETLCVSAVPTRHQVINEAVDRVTILLIVIGVYDRRDDEHRWKEKSPEG
jgi:hypothetical protein